MQNQPSIKQARLGDPEAIASVIQHLLPLEDTTVYTQLKNDYLEITLESPTLPHQDYSVDLVKQIISKIQPQNITNIVVQGRELAQFHPAWTQCIDITQTPPHKPPKPAAYPFKWPRWFPYPSSWLRTTGLFLWAFLVLTIFARFGGFWSSFIYDISNNHHLALLILASSLISAIAVFSYSHHFITSALKKPRKFSKYPGSQSIWEGILAVIILCIATLVFLIVVVPFYPDQCYSYSSYCEFVVSSGMLISFISTLYLYQAEFLIRKHISRQQILKFASIAAVSCTLIISLNISYRNLAYIKGIVNNIVANSQSLIATTTPQTTEPLINSEPPPAAQIESSPEPPPAAQIESSPEPPPEAEIEPPTEPLVNSDPFAEAVRKATEAANLTQTAQSQQDWETISKNWQLASQLMQQVPFNDPNYLTAQDRAVLYYNNYNYSQTMATQATR
ncbi:MAG: hypothetical protein EA414_15440 [Arthrospira sp. PLM2.Bin9]|nr:hypothetical protein [Arthrospira sp. PLM2.Bin9]TVU52806.1 MAG: hypothetical protein EA414_15440 [Arthrospira sp. PLM2.Bin9]